LTVLSRHHGRGFSHPHSAKKRNISGAYPAPNPETAMKYVLVVIYIAVPKILGDPITAMESLTIEMPTAAVCEKAGLELVRFADEFVHVRRPDTVDVRFKCVKRE
jgi:hypothetical protein